MSVTSLEGKGAVVTGSSRGIGRAMALGLAARGASVVINYRTSSDKAEEVVASIRDGGGKAVAVQADVTQPAQVAELFEQATKEVGPLDIVFANAATGAEKAMVDTTEDDFEKFFVAEARATYFTLQEAARRVRDGGRIVATSSITTKMAFPQFSLYNGAKGALEGFVRVLAPELAPRNITVNAILPGFTDTDLATDDDRAVAAQMSPFGRMGDPKDIADVAVFLASDEARWMTGQLVTASGGVV